MNWEAIGAVGEVAGSIAVVVSIIYLAIQVRQNTKSAKLGAERDIAMSFAESFQAYAATTIPSLYRRAADDVTQLSEDEAGQFAMFCIGYFHLMQHAFDQRCEGYLSDRTWESVEKSFRAQMASNGVRAVWSVRGSVFKQDFQDYVNALELDHGIRSSGETIRELITPKQ